MNGKISNYAQVASARRYTITQGQAKGLDVIDCDNGQIRFLVNASKACDIMQLYHEGQNISFISKNGFTNRETDFLSRFEGGMVYTCGLDNLGRRENYPMHGTFHNIPAEIVCVQCNEEGIEIQAIIRDTSLFGKNLVMERRIFSPIGADWVELTDTLINEGYKDENYCLLYHVNIGYPMLDDGARIIADVKSIDGRMDCAEENQEQPFEICDCIPNVNENCYYLDLEKPEISVINKKIGKKVKLSYTQDTLPYFLEWKSMASGDYALGLEPCTTELDGEFTYKLIKPQESIVFQLKLTVSKIE